MTRESDSRNDRHHSHRDTTQEQGMGFMFEHDDRDSRIDRVPSDGEDRESDEHES